MVGRKATAPGGAEEELPAPVESIGDRIDRLRQEKELLELELEVNMLRKRAQGLPDLKTY